MANKIILKKSSVAAKVPLSTDLEVGEISVNLQDQKLYSKKSDGTVILVGSGLGVVGANTSTDNALVRFDGTNGKTIQNSSVTLDDNGNLNNVNAVGFDTTPGTLPTATGSMFWDAGNGTPSIVLDADVTLQLGQEQLALVYNGTGATITNGKVVAVTGAQGARPSVALADADSEALSASTLGIATEDIANGAEGFVTTFGFVRGIDTSAFTAGAPVYLSQTAGGITATRPSAPAHTVALGWVIKVNASSGEIFVNINNGWELSELHDVLISSIANNDALIYNSAQSVWKNTALKTVNGASIIGSGDIVTQEFSSGTTMLFVQTAAPTGWTKSVAHNNKALRVVSGTASSGGTVDFTTAFAYKTPAGTVSNTTATGTVNISAVAGTVSTTVSGTVGNTTLTLAQMAAHSHGISTTSYIQGWNTASNVGAPSSQVVSRYSIGSDPLQTNNPVWSESSSDSQGGNGAHNHSFSGSGTSSFSFTSGTASFTGAAHNHTFSGTAIDLSVKYVDAIIATKD